MRRFRHEDDLALAVDRLIATEPRFARVVAEHGLPPLRVAPPGLESLLRIVTDQLISLKAGEAIWKRLEAGLGGFEPQVILSHPEERLRALGLSGAKARCFHAAARAFDAGHFAPHDMTQIAEEELYRRLTAIPGVGPWTASLYLLTSFQAADAWPAADIALQEAARQLLSLPARPTAQGMVDVAKAWRPYRSAAALLLWSHYRGLKGLRQT